MKYLGIPIAADESVRKAADPLAVARAGAADILVVKAQPLGGVRRALEIVAEAGLPAVVSSALDTSVGLAMGAALAAALPDLDYDCGLGTAALLDGRRRLDPRSRRASGMLPWGASRPTPRCWSSYAASDDRQRMVARADRPLPLRADARALSRPQACGGSMTSCATRASSSLVRRHTAS